MQTEVPVDGRFILAVDDSGDDQFLFGRLLRRACVGYPVESVSSGSGAIEALTRMAEGDRVPLLCFLDIKMPLVDGFDVLGWIRSRSELREMPVLMLSSSEQPLDLKRAAQMQAQGYFKKHPTEAQLMAIVTQVAEAAPHARGVRRIESAANLIPPNS